MRNPKKNAQSVMEYGLIVSLMAIVALGVLTRLSGPLGNATNAASASLSTTNSPSMLDYCKKMTKPNSTVYYTGYDANSGQCN